ncbi:hypothetical protein N825_27240 [Skermanella stibiiresistens SB22]|uniref:histidine kinase n=1 Tax=Skermanella stibiiresistens SB22 TaxID=1385369 RepID=W9H5Y1_9PROT|nr:MASE4 domain-containing protein [Skermanella stibiiresistens]EWY41474.1 hypothetical protein N825_27240 [Skermanella stibiiresistens SB22]
MRHKQPGTFVDESATDGARRIITILSVAYILATLAVLPFAALPGPVIPAVTTTFGAGVLIADLCTGFLLIVHFRAIRSPSLLPLAGAYFFSAAMALLHILTFPGAWIPNEPLIGSAQSVGWLFIFWIVGFPSLVLLAVAIEARSGGRQIAEPHADRAMVSAMVAVLALVGALTVIATAGEAWMPAQLQGNVFASWGNTAQWTSVALSMAAFVALWRNSRGQDALFGWLGLALIAFAAFNALAVSGGARYTIGWDLSRISGFISSCFLLMFFLSQFSRLHRSLAGALARLRHVNENLERRVTERTAELERSNQRLRQALDERSLLLREVYHRVKNNLQVIDSIVAIEASSLRGPPPEDVLRNLRRRINALGLVHQQLMTSSDLATFDIRPFLDELGRDLIASRGGGGGSAKVDVDISVEADALTVDLDFAIPLGLLVTELVLDALRRQDPRDRAGEVRIRLRRSPDAGVTLTVMDNGGAIGPGHGTPHKGGPLGLSVVEALVVQLEGGMAVFHAGGTKVEVRMPLPEIKS